MTIQPHDFSRPPSLHPETRANLVQWMTRTNSRLAEVMSSFALEAEFRLDDCSTAWPLEALQHWSEKTVAYRVKLAGVQAVSIIAVPSPIAQVLIGSLLGDQPTEWPADKDLTPGEQSVAEFLITKMIESLTDAWAGDSPIDLQLGECESNLRRTKVFKFREPFVVCRFNIKTAFGEAAWSWIVPHEFLTLLFGSTRAIAMDEIASPREQLETLARDMSTQVIIRLGGVQLTAPQLSELRVGDLVVLSQKTTEPLRGMISGKPRYLGWPGRVGNRQAFEIASEGPRLDRTAERTPAAAPAHR